MSDHREPEPSEPTAHPVKLERKTFEQQPAFGLYSCKPGEATFRAHSIQILEIRGDAIAALTMYMKPLGPPLFADFDLPLTSTRA